MNRPWILAAGMAFCVTSTLAHHLADVTSPKWRGRMVSHNLAGHPLWPGIVQPDGTVVNPIWPAMHYWVYRPPSAGSRPPLVVYLHGSSQTAVNAALGIRWNELADRKGAIVAYPQQAANTWDWGQSTVFGRGVGDLESVARITRAVQQAYDTDPERTYVVGISSGAITATMLGAMYADHYTAVGSMVGCSYNCADPAGLEAYLAMGANAKVVPAFLVHGTLDHIFTPPLGVQADSQWAGTNDWADNGSPDGSVSQVPEIDTSHLVVTPSPGGSTDACVKPSNNPCPGGPLGYETYPYEIHRYRDAAGKGCTIVESWTLHGLAHNYPYGDPAGTYTDPVGPDVTTPTFEFLQHAGCRNVGPDAVDDFASTSRNVAAVIRPLDNDVDADADTVAIEGVTQPANGTVTRDGATLTYAPRFGFKGRDAFAYTIGDGHGGSDNATVTVCVIQGNYPRGC